MKHIFFLLFVTLPWFAPGQDIVLDPIETTPEAPSARSMASGNWGFGAYRLGELSAEIQRRAVRQVVVYIFDTAGKYSHPGLQAAAWNQKGRTFTGEDNPEDGNGHSTHVAGTYAGTGGAGPVGVADALRLASKIRLVPIKVLSNGGSGSFSNIVAAMQAVENDVRSLIFSGHFVVFNFSLGGSTRTVPTWETELKKFADLGVFTVAASGNTANAGVIYPANSAYTHAVAALQQDLTRAFFSTTGPEVEYAAPGAGIYSTYPPDVYRELSGTSMATPHAGAVAAIVASVYPSATAEQVAAHIARYSKDLDDVGRDDKTGYGIADIGAMLANAPEGSVPDPDPDPEPEPDPDPSPVRTMTGQPDRQYTATWNTLDDLTPRKLIFRIAVDYRHEKQSEAAMAELLDLTNRHFRNRGYTLPAGTDEYEAAYWVAFFYRLILGSAGYDAQPVLITIQGSGIEVQRRDLESRKRPARMKRIATRSNAITYTF